VWDTESCAIAALSQTVRAVTTTEPDESNELLDLLALEELDTNLYRAGQPERPLTMHLFGGQVAAQALRAAAATVPDDRPPHSLHGYFLRGGRPDRPIIMTVDRDRDGRSFSARHVNAIQDGEVIFSMLASFHVDEDGVDYQLDPMPPGIRDPETIEDSAQPHGMFDMRNPGKRDPDAWGSSRIWARPRARVPDDRVVQACVLTYLSDMGWAFGDVPGLAGTGGPSLDHAVWFHRAATVNQWVLLDLEATSVSGSRGVFRGTIRDREGCLVASIAQEALLRARSAT
jgi:acyl-CoA thioesterase-2